MVYIVRHWVGRMFLLEEAVRQRTEYDKYLDRRDAWSLFIGVIAFLCLWPLHKLSTNHDATILANIPWCHQHPTQTWLFGILVIGAIECACVYVFLKTRLIENDGNDADYRRQHSIRSVPTH